MLRKSFFRIPDVNKVDEKVFRLYYLEKVQNLAFSILTFNICCLVYVSTNFIDYGAFFHGDPCMSEEPKFSLDVASLGYVASWLFCTVICLGYFIVLYTKPFVLVKYLEVDLYDIWISIGNLILAIRCYLAVASLTSGYLENQSCYGLHALPDKTLAFYYLMYITILDVMQSFVVCSLPFPWPWAFYVSLLIFFEQVLRTYSCAEYVILPTNLKNNVLNGFVVFAVCYFFIVVSVVSLSFERSIKASYYNTQNQKQVGTKTKKVVDLLCTDVKVTVRQVMSLLEDIIQQTPQTMELDRIVSKIKASGNSIHTAVDHLLFIAKVGEGRFAFSRDADVYVNLMSIVVKEVELSIAGIQRNAEDKLLGTLEVHGPENIEASTDLRCLRVLIYYGMLAMHVASRETVTEKTLVIASVIEDELKNTFINLSIQCARRPGPNSLKDEDRDSPIYQELESIFVLCTTLVNAYGGIISTGRDVFAFTLPTITRSEVKRDDPILTPSSAGESSRGMRMANLIRESVCAYITVPSVEGLFIDALCMLPGGSDITTYRDLNIIDLKLRKVAIVQTVEARDELKQASFQGQIVLFSEKLSYLDAAERSKFHFLVPLPSSTGDMAGLIVFLKSCLEPNISSARSKTRSVQSSEGYHNAQLGQVSANKEILVGWSAWLSMGTVPISKPKLENFIRWRFMNPGGDLYHHTTNVEYFGVFAVFYQSLQYKYGLVNNLYFGGLLLGTTLILYRGSIYSLIERYISFRACWYGGSLSTITGNVLGFGSNLLNFFITPTPVVRARSINDFLTANTNGIAFTGPQLLFLLIDSPLSIKFLGDFVPWPACMICSLFIVFRNIMLITIVLEKFIPASSVRVLTTLVVGMYGSLLCVGVFVENLYRREYLQLHDLMMSRAYFEKCLVLVRELDVHLKELVRSQQGVLDLMVEAGMSEGFVVQESLLQSIHKLQQNVLIAKQLNLEMDITKSDTSKPSVERTQLMDAMKAVLLRPIVCETCAKFVDDYHQQSVPVYLRISKEVSVVRIDPDFFAAVLCKMLRRALERIEESVARERRVLRRNEVTKHEVLIWLLPLELGGGRQYGFKDVRKLGIIVMDTAQLESVSSGNASATPKGSPGASGASMKGGPCRPPLDRNSNVHSNGSTDDVWIRSEKHSDLAFPLSENYQATFDLKGPGVKYEEGTLWHRQYQSYQRLAVPYLLCPDSQRYETLLRREMLDKIWKIDVYSKQFYPHYLKVLQEVGTTPGTSRSSSSNGSRLRRPSLGSSARERANSSKRNSDSGVGTALESFNPSASPQHRHSQYAQNGRPGSNYDASNRKMGSPPSTPMTSSYARRPEAPAPVGNVAIFTPQHGDLKRFGRHNQQFFVERGWRYRIHELNSSVVQTFSLPDMSVYTGLEAVIIEYLPSESLLANGGAKSLTWSKLQLDSHYELIRILVHHLRLHGFVGVIALMGPHVFGEGGTVINSPSPTTSIKAEYKFDDVLPFQEDETRQQQQQQQCRQQQLMMVIPPRHGYREAVAADIYLPLPMTPEKVDLLVDLVDRRLVELALSTYVTSDVASGAYTSF